MKILFITDLHLCDARNSPEFEVRRLEKLADLIRSGGYRMVFNLGDTVSRRNLLRPGFADEEAGFAVYLQWRAQFDIPFVDCAVSRELGFFAKLLGREPDSIREFGDVTTVTVTPLLGVDHEFTSEQVDFLLDAVKHFRTPYLIIGSHVPYPGSCSRPIAPGIYLDIPESLSEALERAEHPVFWAGGHFHWPEEDPRRFGALTVFCGGRFNAEGGNKSGYLRTFDTETGEVATILSGFNW